MQMKISITDALNQDRLEKVILNSYEQSLYLVSVIINGKEFFVTDEEGNFLKSFNKLELQKMFLGRRVQKVVVRHESCYDEMIGLSSQKDENTLEVLIGGEEYASP